MDDSPTPSKRQRRIPYVEVHPTRFIDLITPPLSTPPLQSPSPAPPPPPREPLPPSTSGQFHPDHDGEGDVILQSKENIQFRVESFMLKALSGLFRDMLNNEHLGRPPGDQGSSHHRTIISLPDDHSDEIALFLKFMQSPTPPSDLPIEKCLGFLRLCDKYRAAIPVERMMYRLNSATYTKKYPWEIFCLASNNKDLDLARNAIKSLDNDPRSRYLRLRYPQAEKMSEEVGNGWFVALLRAVEKVSPLAELGPAAWQRVSKEFRPQG